MAGYAACFTTYIRCCPMFLVQRQSSELPATTVGESSRGGSLRRHKGGLWTVHLFSHHQVLLQGGFFKCQASCAGVGKVPGTVDANGPRWLRRPRVQAPGTERSVKRSCARRSTPQQIVRRNAGALPGPSGSTRAYERSRQRHAHQVSGTRCSACGGWLCARPCRRDATERATPLQHRWR